MSGMVCRSCGITLRARAKFCDECGVALSSDSAKYRQVTVLFADVVRSMAIAATVDAERLREIMSDLVERCAAAVRRYGGTPEYTGDGVMALFGAPVALEDHAFRGCVAALAIQDEVRRLDGEVRRRDGITLQVRVGLNSGRVIVGEIGSGALGYAATGEPVGMAQRMEAVAPAGGVMMTESTARLVEHRVVLADPEFVYVKGADSPVRARRLTAIGARDTRLIRTEAGLVGRRPEMTALRAQLDRAIDGRGGVVLVVGPAGIGKSRVAREAAHLATARGVEVAWGFCESHVRDVPFHALTRLLRAAYGVADLESAPARARVREQIPDADPGDLMLLDDLLEIADPDVVLPQMDVEARRRRVMAMVTAGSSARRNPALFVVEDAHWIDTVSESLLAELLDAAAHSSVLVLITARPEYRGVLSRISGARTITLAPLDDCNVMSLVGELVGADPSVGKLIRVVAERAAGNPFFAEEIVRDLVQRRVLEGVGRAYVCFADVAEISVPATVEAAIEARIDRLARAAKTTLDAASVIGVRFSSDLLESLGFEPALTELLDNDLVEQVRTAPNPEYTFRHPLIRSVAYDSQLRSDRVDWHRRVAAAIEDRAAGSVEASAALIAEHRHAAGELGAAYGWYMRAGAWSVNRNLSAARVSWERASEIADLLADKNTELLPMRIAPRTMLCATVGIGSVTEQGPGRFEELRELCESAGDKVSLAIGMAGPITELLYSGRSPEGAQLAAEQMALLDSIDDHVPLMSLAFLPFCTWVDYGETDQLLRWTQTVVELADGDPAKGGGFGLASPLACAKALRGYARWWRGIAGWQDDLREAVVVARDSNAETFSAVVAWVYAAAFQYGVLRPDDTAMRDIEDAVRASVNASNVAGALANYALGVALLNRDDAAERQRGVEVMTRVREIISTEKAIFLDPIAHVWQVGEAARGEALDGPVVVMRSAATVLQRDRRLGYGVWVIARLAETLLQRCAQGDIAEARAAIDWLDDLREARQPGITAVTVVRLRALLAKALGDVQTYRGTVDRYRAMADSLGFVGHIALAAAMTADSTDGPAPALPS